MSVGARLRFNVFFRDKFTCQYCGRKAPHVELQVDHIVPVSRGGLDVIENLTTSCAECNNGKSKTAIVEEPKIDAMAWVYCEIWQWFDAFGRRTSYYDLHVVEARYGTCHLFGFNPRLPTENHHYSGGVRFKGPFNLRKDSLEHHCPIFEVLGVVRQLLLSDSRFNTNHRRVTVWLEDTGLAREISVETKSTVTIAKPPTFEIAPDTQDLEHAILNGRRLRGRRG